MAVDTAHLVVTRPFPVVIKGLHDMTDETGFRLVRETVGKEINAKIAEYDNNGQREQEALLFFYEPTDRQSSLPPLLAVFRIREGVPRAFLLL